MQIKQWEDKNLSHFSYGILSDDKKVVLIDPSRNPQQYLDYAKDHDANIIGIIETHPHADFVSGHVEIHKKTGATIYTSSKVDATYVHEAFDEQKELQIGNIKLTALNTPGHSPDSICILLEHEGKQKAVFTGDTLFIGDCGRPDLRPGDGNAKEEAEKLAKQMYHSLREKLMVLDDETVVYPAHGAGTLCGKALSKANSSTIGEEKKTNWSLKEQTQDEFVQELLSDQPFVPLYFPFDVQMNRKGALHLNESIDKIKTGKAANDNVVSMLDKTFWVIDTRKEEDYKKGHLPHSINLMEEGKFETWLGSIINPDEQFYLVSKTEEQLKRMLERTAVIGYEGQVAEGFVFNGGTETQEIIDIKKFKEDPDSFTIVDVRNTSEVKEGKPFKNSISIPLPELRKRINEIPTNKPIVVHCAAGYRSAAASSLIKSKVNEQALVYDLGDAIKEFL